eukprot:Ihof_evm2s696 gene=Ihof_evmTU2s696
MPGWEVAANNTETKAVMISTRFQFSYICKVTASGKSYSVGFDEPMYKADNTPAYQFYSECSCTGDDCCQNVIMKVPTEWELAMSTMPRFTEA